MKASTDHVVFSAITQAFECQHCGGSHAPALPMPIDQYVSVGRGFMLMHKLCRPAPLPDRQMKLPGTEEGDPPHNAEAAAQGRALEGKVALCWADLWPQLKMVLSDEDYHALVAYTPFAEKLHQKDFNTIAAWVARELSEEPGVLQPRPAPLCAWLERALTFSSALSAEPPPAEKPKRRRKPRTPERTP